MRRLFKSIMIYGSRHVVYPYDHDLMWSPY